MAGLRRQQRNVDMLSAQRRTNLLAQRGDIAEWSANPQANHVFARAGVFYVTVTDQMLNQEEKPSIWTRWFRSEHKRKVTILMEPKTPGFDLTVFDDNGQRTASDVAEQILIMIREFAT
jgi:hypothetical protein